MCIGYAIALRVADIADSTTRFGGAMAGVRFR
jgi:hypothetical protein